MKRAISSLQVIFVVALVLAGIWVASYIGIRMIYGSKARSNVVIIDPPDLIRSLVPIYRPIAQLDTRITGRTVIFKPDLDWIH